MTDQVEKLTQFTSITGAPEDRARFFLESSAWNVEMAVGRYFENDGDDVEIVESTPPTIGQSDASSISRKVPQPKGNTSNVKTINTITTSSDEEEEGQAYYAGGSEHSGQQVLGPPKKRDIVADMFKSVQENGVEILEQSGASGSNSRAFRGTGYKLGQDNDDSVVIPGATEPAPPREVTLRLWSDGFSLNDGDLRAYSDPANRDFLNSIRQGEIPQELRHGGAEIHLAMEDHRNETFKKIQNKNVKPFQGQGYTLGSPAPTVVNATKEEDKPNNEARAKELLNINNSEPITNLQIRLADGSRLVGQFNHEHTIAAVRTYITTARPQYESQPFNLLSTYPSKVLDDEQTLAEAGLLNAAIMQKLV